MNAPLQQRNFLFKFKWILSALEKPSAPVFHFKRTGSYFSWMEAAGILRARDNRKTVKEKLCCGIWSKAWKVGIYFLFFAKCLPKAIFSVVAIEMKVKAVLKHHQIVAPQRPDKEVLSVFRLLCNSTSKWNQLTVISTKVSRLLFFRKIRLTIIMQTTRRFTYNNITKWLWCIQQTNDSMCQNIL